MKNIILSGRLVADPVLKTVGEQNATLANFRLANADSDRENAEFYDVHAWEKLAEFCEGYLHKGMRVYIMGTFNNEQYKDAEGKNRTHFEITAHKIEFGESRNT